VLDRFIQQAVMQALQRSWDGRFSEHSYGFRPKRSAHQAVEKAQQYQAEGYRWHASVNKTPDAISAKRMARECLI
jgi:RNA-directed DNA polymerase